jgi:nucleoid DNA-binding protein
MAPRKTTTKKVAAKKTKAKSAIKKTAAKKTIAKKTAAKKTAAKKTIAKKITAKKTTAKKTAASITKMPKTAIKAAWTKSQVFQCIADNNDLSKKQVKEVFESLNTIMECHLKPRSIGQFTLPGISKFKVQKKAATKARKGTNPFTGEEMMFKAKPARNIVKARPLKKLKEMAEK